MRETFMVRNGWVGKQVGSAYYMFNVRDREFAVFGSDEEFEHLSGKFLRDARVEPTPDFLAEPHFSAMTLTTRCNMNCPYCYVQPIYGDGAMTAEEARSAVRALAELTDDELVIFAWGGEPTQNPDALIAMIEEAAGYGNIKVLLISNGVMSGHLLERLLSYNNLVFQISYDGQKVENVQKPLKTKKDSLAGMLSSMETISKVSSRVSLRCTVTARNVRGLHEELIPTASRFTNRLVMEHLHTTNGRSVNLKSLAPSIDEYTDLVFDIVPKAEAQGLHVKALPLDQIREGGPNDNMTFLNVLTDGSVTVSNAVIHHSHRDFSELCIGRMRDGHIEFATERNGVLADRYLRHYREQCRGCFARPICRGSVQRYLFITHDTLGEWDDRRCRYYRAVIARWFDEIIPPVRKFLNDAGHTSGLVRLIPPEDKVQYPVFVMEGGFSLSIGEVFT